LWRLSSCTLVRGSKPLEGVTGSEDRASSSRGLCIVTQGQTAHRVLSRFRESSRCSTAATSGGCAGCLLRAANTRGCPRLFARLSVWPDGKTSFESRVRGTQCCKTEARDVVTRRRVPGRRAWPRAAGLRGGRINFASSSARGLHVVTLPEPGLLRRGWTLLAVRLSLSLNKSH